MSGINYKVSPVLYIVLLTTSIIITGFTFFINDNSWNTIVASLGAGGIASVIVAWLTDIRNSNIRKKEDMRKTDEVMDQFIRIFLRLMRTVAEECYSTSNDGIPRSFEKWIEVLTSQKTIHNDSDANMLYRSCRRIAGCVTSLQRQIEVFQSQSPTLVFSNFLNIEQALSTLDIMWIHCWGTLQQFESENYKAFCETLNILYVDFNEAFPKYKNRFPKEYTKDLIHV